MVTSISKQYVFLTFLLSIFFSASYAQLENSTEPEVSINQGTLRGITLTTRNGRSISAFLGIPYAQPPIGNLRFTNPVPANGWSEIRNASSDGNACPQMSDNGEVGDEDCLYLNVYTPESLALRLELWRPTRRGAASIHVNQTGVDSASSSGAPKLRSQRQRLYAFTENARYTQLPENIDDPLLPVMVYIHGGGFTQGSSNSKELGPEYLLDEDLLLVVMNYRLGTFGFLSTGDEVASGNWGLKDQVLALEWVQENIAFFGGDPDQVTLVGESAGGASVHLLSLSNSTIGLFHRYVCQSGSALASWAYRPRFIYANRAFELGKFVGCPNDNSDVLIDCLRNVDVSDIVAAQPMFLEWETLPRPIWGSTDEPDIEGAFLTDSPTNLIAAGQIRRLPCLTGVVKDEGLSYSTEFYVNDNMLHDFRRNKDHILPLLLGLTHQPDGGAAWIEAIKSYYFNDEQATDAILLTNLTFLIGDALFFHPVRKVLEQRLAMDQNSQYFYTFEYSGTYSNTFINANSSASYGVAHADDLIYMFPSEWRFSKYAGNLTESDFEMVGTMTQLWTAFAINGTPTACALNESATWEPFSSEGNYLQIGNGSDVGLQIEDSFLPDRMQFWENLTATEETT